MAADTEELKKLAIAFTTAVATAGRLAEELDRAVSDLNGFIERRDAIEERRSSDRPYRGKERRRG